MPYLYSAMWVSHTDGIAPVRPMYHDHPLAQEAYEVPNQYMFGPDMLVAPITTPVDRQTHLGQVTSWLPEGTWFDVFTGRRYDGGRRLILHRTLAEMPVFARAGAVVPLAADPMANARASPEALVLRVFPGADGGCVLLEDAGRGDPGVEDRQETAITLKWGQGDRTDLEEEVVLTVAPPTGPGVLTSRTLTVEFIGVDSMRRGLVRAGEREVAVRVVPAEGDAPSVVELGTVNLSAGLELRLDRVRMRRGDIAVEAFALLDDAEIAYDVKTRVMELVGSMSGTALISALHVLDLPGNLYGALMEIVSAAGDR